ncbi:MAG: hypothetical protein BWX74_00060 [Tenericutes bacterium ADurb.Bin087]|nr:MAG: hypothetical protein BWX74_00060 [Tenericutes bacterium ADurb.Bin087]
MAQKPVTFRIVFKRYRTQRRNFKSYLLLTLAFLAISFVTIYLNSTDFALIGAVILVFVIFPLIVVFAEYTALIESGAPAPRNSRAYFDLYRNTYRSGRLRYIFSFRNVILFLIYFLLGMFVAGLGMTIFIYFFDKVTYEQMFNLMVEFQNTTTPDALNILVTKVETLLAPYLEGQILAYNLVATLGIIFIIVKGVFNIYLSIFIEHRPTTSFTVLRNTFINDAETKTGLRRVQTNTVLIVFTLYTVLNIGGYFLLKVINPHGPLFLQAELLGLIALSVCLPFVTRITFYLYHSLMEKKRVQILRFAIVELREIIKNPGLPAQTKEYITQVLKVREQEYATLTAVDSEHKVVTEEVDTDVEVNTNEKINPENE